MQLLSRLLDSRRPIPGTGDTNDSKSATHPGFPCIPLRRHTADTSSPCHRIRNLQQRQADIHLRGIVTCAFARRRRLIIDRLHHEISLSEV